MIQIIRTKKQLEYLTENKDHIISIFKDMNSLNIEKWFINFNEKTILNKYHISILCIHNFIVSRRFYSVDNVMSYNIYYNVITTCVL